MSGECKNAPCATCNSDKGKNNVVWHIYPDGEFKEFLLCDECCKLWEKGKIIGSVRID